MKAHYSNNQLLFIKTALAMRTPPLRIISDFRQYYAESNPTIYGEDIDEIKDTYSDDIREIAKRELSDNNAVAVSFSRVRLEIINKGVFDCLTPKFLGSSPITMQEDGKAPMTYYKEKVGMDIPNLVKLLDLAQKEDFFARKLRLEKLSRGITSSDPILDGPGTPIVTVYTGYDSEDTKLLVESTEEVDAQD